jgi:acetylglutamate kinase
VLNVVKLGGAAAADSEALCRTAGRIVALPGRSVVVHGGGAEISSWQERLGMPKRVVQAFTDLDARAV